MPQRKRRPGNAWKDSPHARFYLWEIKSPAFRSLSVGARALLLELKALFNGSNNGSLFLSVRDAGLRLNVGKTCAAKLFRELLDRGFIRTAERGAFNLKSRAGQRKATTWILTEHPMGDALDGTKDFMRWQPSSVPAQNHLTVRPRGQTVRPRGPLTEKSHPKAQKRPPWRTVSSILRAKRSAPADTGTYTMGDGVGREAA
jgi:hypothetical protein